MATVEDLASELGVSRNVAYDLVRTGGRDRRMGANGAQKIHETVHEWPRRERENPYDANTCLAWRI
jgi:hypothetical protein